MPLGIFHLQINDLQSLCRVAQPLLIQGERGGLSRVNVSDGLLLRMEETR